MTKVKLTLAVTLTIFVGTLWVSPAIHAEDLEPNIGFSLSFTHQQLDRSGYSPGINARDVFERRNNGWDFHAYSDVQIFAVDPLLTTFTLRPTFGINQISFSGRTVNFIKPDELEMQSIYFGFEGRFELPANLYFNLIGQFGFSNLNNIKHQNAAATPEKALEGGTGFYLGYGLGLAWKVPALEGLELHGRFMVRDYGEYDGSPGGVAQIVQTQDVKAKTDGWELGLAYTIPF